MVRERLASLRVRLVATTVAVLAVALAAGGWMIIRSVEGTQQARLRVEVERRLDLVAKRLEAGDDLGSALAAAGPIGLVQLRDPQSGEVLFVAGPVTGTIEDATIPLDGPLPAPGEQVAARVAETPGIGVELETVTRTVRTPDGPVTVQAAAPADEVARSVAAVQRALLLGLPVLLTMVTSAAWVLVGRALRPVEEMRRQVEAISGSTLHRRVPEPDTGDEVARLARTMNHMLDRLEDSSTRQREFISDASHELRSPVATIRTELEVAQASDDASGLRGAVERALAEEERLEQLLGDLLLLATVQGGDTTWDPVPLDDVIRSEASRARRLRVAVIEPLPEAHVPGRRTQLERVAANLLDNATRHARSTVEVRLAVDGDEVVLTVDDDGPGIPEADRERVFNRFTRLDEGRARAEGGAGLGLALARTIVQRHGGTLKAVSSPLGGARLLTRLRRIRPL